MVHIILENTIPPLHRERDLKGVFSAFAVSMQGELLGSSRRTGEERCGWRAARRWEPTPSHTFRTPAYRPSGCLSKQARPEPHTIYELGMRDAAMQRPLYSCHLFGTRPRGLDQKAAKPSDHSRRSCCSYPRSCIPGGVLAGGAALIPLHVCSCASLPRSRRIYDRRSQYCSRANSTAPLHCFC